MENKGPGGCRAFFCLRFFLRLLNEAREPDQKYGPDDGHDNAPNHPASGINPKQIEDPSSDNSANNTEQNVHERAIPSALHDFSGGPARNQAGYDPGDKSHVVLPETSRIETPWRSLSYNRRTDRRCGDYACTI